MVRLTLNVLVLSTRILKACGRISSCLTFQVPLYKLLDKMQK